MQVNIFYKDEFIATGETTYSPWAFWTYIKPSPEMDQDRLIARLKEIQTDFGTHYDFTGSSIGFAPAYEARKSEGLI